MARYGSILLAVPSSIAVGDPVSLHHAQVYAPNDVIVYAEGGAVCSEESGGRYTPSSSVVKHLCAEALRSLHTSLQVHIVVPNSSLVLSEDVSMERMEEYTLSLQELFKSFHARHVVVLAGSHKLPRYGSASMLALEPEDLGVCSRSQATAEGTGSGALIIASTRYAANTHRTAAINTVRDALQLAIRPAMQGRAAALHGDCLYALPGLDRPKDVEYLNSRYPARGSKDQGEWYFTSRKPYDVPTGDGTPVQFDRNVRTYVFGNGTENSMDAMIEAIWKDKLEHNLSAIVLKRADGSHPLAYCDPQNLESINQVGIPIVAVGDRRVESSRVCERPGDYSNIIDGGAAGIGSNKSLYSGEAKILLAYWLKCAENVGYSDIEDVVAYVRQKLDAYPFR